MSGASVLMALAFTIVSEVNQGGGLYVDLLNLQWWQIFLGIVAGLGLSPAPWLLGLAVNRIQFTGPADRAHQKQIAEADAAHKREIEAKDAAHARELTARDAYHQGLMTGQLQRYADLERSNSVNVAAAERERARADEVTDAALELGEVLRANTHVLASIGESAEIVKAGQQP